LFVPPDDIVVLLVAERDKLNRAIEALGAPVRRRGRAPKTAQPIAVAAPAPIAWKRKPMTAAQKKALSVKMKAAWAKRK